MAPIKIKHIVSFTSQDPRNCVENLCDASSSENRKPWLCSREDRSGLLKVELQMELASVIGFIDVGNYGSAFIHIAVGRSSWPINHPYITLLPTATLMTPADSRQGASRQGVRMFKRVDFLPEAADESWDRLRITCSQPFKKSAQFGLSFLRVRSAVECTQVHLASQDDTPSQAKRTPDRPTSVGEWLCSPAVQRTFFNQKAKEDSPEKGPRNAGKLSRAERMVFTVTQKAKRALPTSPCSVSQGTCVQRDHQHSLANPKPEPKVRRSVSPSLNVKTTQLPQSRKHHSKARQNRGNRASSSSKRLWSEDQAAKQSLSSVSSSKYSFESELESEEPESLCPLCGVSVSPDNLPLHASSCLAEEFGDFLSVMDTGVVTTQTQLTALGSGVEEPMVTCPLCAFRFPSRDIEQHASTCGDTVWVD